MTNKAGQRTWQGWTSYNGPEIPENAVTHEAFVGLVVKAIIEGADLTEGERQRIARAKITYGAGDGSYRGICYYGDQDFTSWDRYAAWLAKRLNVKRSS
jgi:hypothetical protein